jgi:hypothetical protein
MGSGLCEHLGAHGERQRLRGRHNRRHRLRCGRRRGRYGGRSRDTWRRLNCGRDGSHSLNRSRRRGSLYRLPRPGAAFAVLVPRHQERRDQNYHGQQQPRPPAGRLELIEILHCVLSRGVDPPLSLCPPAIPSGAEAGQRTPSPNCKNPSAERLDSSSAKGQSSHTSC